MEEDEQGNKKLSQLLRINKELTSSLFNAVTERPSPPDQSWSCFTEGQEDREKGGFSVTSDKGEMQVHLSCIKFQLGALPPKKRTSSHSALQS